MGFWSKSNLEIRSFSLLVTFELMPMGQFPPQIHTLTHLKYWGSGIDIPKNTRKFSPLMASQQCCKNPPIPSPDNGEEGELLQIGGFNCYVSGPRHSNISLILISDVFGIFFFLFYDFSLISVIILATFSWWIIGIHL